MLALLILDELEVLQSGNDVIRLDGGHVAEALDADAAFMVSKYLRRHKLSGHETRV